MSFWEIEWEIWKSYERGIGQGVLNTINGLQDSAIGILNTAIHAGPGGTLLDVAEIFGATTRFKSPDWSKGLLGSESEFAHKASKFLGATGVEAGATAGLLRLASWVGSTKWGRILNNNRYLRIGPGNIPKGKPFTHGPGQKVPTLRIGNSKPTKWNHFDLRLFREMNTKNTIQATMSKILGQHVAELKQLNASDLKKIPEYIDVDIPINDKSFTVATWKSYEEDRIIIVVQAYSYGFLGMGTMMADGFICLPNGGKIQLPDRIRWEYC
jgi:hypothetical protein